MGNVFLPDDVQYKERRLVVSYSSKRAIKDRRERERLVERLMKKVKDGRIKIRDLVKNSGSKRFIQIIKDEARINRAKIEDAVRWDGLHGVISNHPEKTAIELLEKYRALWNIEAAFRVNKHNLKM